MLLCRRDTLKIIIITIIIRLSSVSHFLDFNVCGVSDEITFNGVANLDNETKKPKKHSKLPWNYNVLSRSLISLRQLT